MQQGAAIYVSGSAKHMPQDVIDALRAAMVMHGGMDDTEATTHMKKLQASQQLCIEAWS